MSAFNLPPGCELRDLEPHHVESDDVYWEHVDHRAEELRNRERDEEENEN